MSREFVEKPPASLPVAILPNNEQGSDRASDSESPNHPGLLSGRAAEQILAKGTRTEKDNLISTSAPSFTFAHLHQQYQHFNESGTDRRRSHDESDLTGPSAASGPSGFRLEPLSESKVSGTLGAKLAATDAANDENHLPLNGHAKETSAKLEPWKSSIYRVEVDKNNKIRVLRSKNHLQINYTDMQKPLSNRIPVASFMDQLEIPSHISKIMELNSTEDCKPGGGEEGVNQSPRLLPVDPSVPITLTAGDIILPHRNVQKGPQGLYIESKKSPSQRLLQPQPSGTSKLLRSHSRSSSNSSLVSLSRPSNFLQKLLSLGGLLHFEEYESESVDGASERLPKSNSSADSTFSREEPGASDLHRKVSSSSTANDHLYNLNVYAHGKESRETSSVLEHSQSSHNKTSPIKALSRTPSIFQKIFKKRPKSSSSASSASSKVSSNADEAEHRPIQSSPLTTQFFIGDPNLGSQTTVQINTKLLDKLHGLTVREEQKGTLPSLPAGWMRAEDPSSAGITESTGVSLANSPADNSVLGSSNGAGTPAQKLLEEKYGALLEMLGKGAFGEVKLAQIEEKDPNNTGQTVSRPVAIKSFVRRKDESAKEYSKKAIAEFCIASSLHHPNIVKTFDLIKDQDGDWSVVMEYMAGGDLFSRLKDKDILDQNEINCYFKQLISGVAYLHSMGVAHRDIKPENLLLDKSFRLLKLADFGTAEVFKTVWQKTPRKLKGVVGSGPYIAPEEFQENAEYDAPKVDIWACAMIYHTMIFQSIPWRTAKPADPLYARFLKNKNSHIFAMSRLSPPVRSLIYKMFEPDSQQRISSAEIMLEPFIRSIPSCTPDSDSPRNSIEEPNLNGAATLAQRHQH